MANKESMRAICRAVEIAQSMMLSHVVPHALFLALYETNRKEIEKFLRLFPVIRESRLEPLADVG